MPSLAQIQTDLVSAMKAHDSLRSDVLKMLKAAVANWEIAQGKTAGADELLKLISTQVKQRRDAAQQFRDAARPELAEKEEAEAAILQAYLPEQLGEDEVKALVAAAVAETGATSGKDIGKVMGALMPKVKGKADGGLVNRLVQEALGGLTRSRGGPIARTGVH